jgi:FlaG/FlaF family flagellin (archaellin)
MMSKWNNDAVSPVVGIMLMLVVTIIIATIVSGFAGSLTESQSKTPQAKITATFSVSDGMTISHAGGEAIPLNDLVFTTQNGPGFGPNVEEISTQKLNPDLITDKDGNSVFSTGSTGGKSSFNPGDTFFISPDNCECSFLQPSIVSSSYYSVSYLCFQNPDNVGKVFTLQAGDRAGNIISTTEVKITA